MAVAELGTAIRMPSSKQLSKAITIGITYTSGGAATEVTITLDSDYPPIDLSIQSPILGIFLIADETAVAVDDIQIFLPTGQVARASTPDTAGTFQISGAREIVLENTPDKNGIGWMTYIPKGSPALT